MTIPEMLGQSGILTLLGMGVVFAFLIVLIMCMKLVEILVKIFSSGADETGQSTSGSAPVSADQNQATIAAIAVAVNERQKH
jgi:oxaloacetate decarboxylase gamma subunit